MPLTEFEEPVAEVIDSVLTGEDDRLSEFRDRIESDRTGNSVRFTTFKKSVGDAIDGKGWFARGGRRFLGIWIVVFVVLAVVLLWTGIHGFRSVSPRWSDVVRIALGLCAATNAVALIFAASKAPLWRRRTTAGQSEAERWEAFRRYLTDFPRLQEAPPATLELWERYLVYGIAFGIAERVLQGAHLLMPQALHDQSAIYWISPTGDLGSGPTALAIGDLSSGLRLGARASRLERRRRRLLRRRRGRRRRWRGRRLVTGSGPRSAGVSGVPCVRLRWLEFASVGPLIRCQTARSTGSKSSIQRP